jgi:hypothetical protein
VRERSLTCPLGSQWCAGNLLPLSSGIISLPPSRRLRFQSVFVVQATKDGMGYYPLSLPETSSVRVIMQPHARRSDSLRTCEYTAHSMVWARSCPYASEHIPSGAPLTSTRIRYERRTAAHHGQPGGWAAGCAPAMHECSCASETVTGVLTRQHCGRTGTTPSRVREGLEEQSLLSSSLCWNARIIRARRARIYVRMSA